MDRPNLLLATPCYGGVVHAGYMHSVLRLQRRFAELGLPLTVDLLENESVFTRARSYYVARMLSNPQYTHILNVDADIVFEPDSVLGLLSADKDVIGGCYPRKALSLSRLRSLADTVFTDAECEQIAAEYIVNVVTPDYQPEQVQVAGGLMQVGHIGGGFVLIKRQVLERMASAYPELKFEGGIRGYNPPGFCDCLYSLWEYMIDPESKRYLSDDWAFCKRWRKLGGEVWADLRCDLTHIGTHAFKGSYGQHLVYRHQNPEWSVSDPSPDHPDGCPTWIMT